MKAIALLLAALLWVVVSARAPAEAYVTVRVEPELDGALSLVGTPPQVRALVSGRTADLMRLYATPPVVRRAVSGEEPDTIVIAVTPGDVHLPAELTDAVRVIDVQPRGVTLRFASRAPRRRRVAP